VRVLDGVSCYVTDVMGGDRASAAISTPQRVVTRDQVPAVVICPDVFGLSKHVCVLADEMSRRSGWPVVVVDYFEGTAAPSSVMDVLVHITAPTPPDSPSRSCLQRFVVWTQLQALQ
jgi:dienelactone hydrolase